MRDLDRGDEAEMWRIRAAVTVGASGLRRR
jgi:hypothetical protein